MVSDPAELRRLDVSGRVVIDNLHVLQLPRFCFRMIGGVSSEIIARDVILFVLLQDLHAVEFIFARLERLNEPRAIVGAVAKNLADDALVLAARVRFLDKGAAGKVGVRRQSVIEGRGPERSEEADQQQREK